MESEPSQTPACEHPWIALSLIADPWKPTALMCDECGARWDMQDGDIEDRLAMTACAFSVFAQASSVRHAETERRLFMMERYMTSHQGAGHCDFCDVLAPVATLMAVGPEIRVCVHHVPDAIGHMLEGDDRARALRAASIWVHGWQTPPSDLRRVRVGAGLAALTGQIPSPTDALDCAADSALVVLRGQLARFLAVPTETSVRAVVAALASRLDVSEPQTAPGRAVLITVLCALDRALDGPNSDLVDRENPVESLLADIGVPDPECEYAAVADLLAAEGLSATMLLDGGWEVLEEAIANLVVAFAQDVFGPAKL